MAPSRGSTDRPLLSWTPARTAGPTDRAPLILLHGAEDEPADVLGWAEALDPGQRWCPVAVAAPFGSEGEGRVWFRTTPRGPEPADLDEALHRLEATIDHLGRSPDGSVRPATVVGYSQGGAVALMLAAHAAAGSVRTVVSICGWLPDVEGRALGDPDRSEPAPRVLVANTRGDAVVPVDFGDAAVVALGSAGMAVDGMVTDGGHHPDASILAAIGDWLVRAGAERSGTQSGPGPRSGSAR